MRYTPDLSHYFLLSLEKNQIVDCHFESSGSVLHGGPEFDFSPDILLSVECGVFGVGNCDFFVSLYRWRIG